MITFNIKPLVDIQQIFVFKTKSLLRIYQICQGRLYNITTSYEPLQGWEFVAV
jgi:hypothetical protein